MHICIYYIYIYIIYICMYICMYIYIYIYIYIFIVECQSKYKYMVKWHLLLSNYFVSSNFQCLNKIRKKYIH